MLICLYAFTLIVSFMSCNFSYVLKSFQYILVNVWFCMTLKVNFLDYLNAILSSIYWDLWNFPILLRIRDRKKSMVVHHDMVKQCSDRHLPLWIQRMRSNLLVFNQTSDSVPTGSSDIDDASVDSVPTDNSWEDEDDLGLGSMFRDGLPTPGSDISRDWENTDWIQCDKCRKWRAVSKQEIENYAHSVWDCRMNNDPQYASCSVPEENFREWEDFVNQQGLTFSVSEGQNYQSQTVQPNQSWCNHCINIPAFVG